MYLQCLSPVALDSAAGLKCMSRGGIVFVRRNLSHVNISYSKAEKQMIVIVRRNMMWCVSVCLVSITLQVYISKPLNWRLHNVKGHIFIRYFFCFCFFMYCVCLKLYCYFTVYLWHGVIVVGLNLTLVHITTLARQVVHTQWASVHQAV